MSQTRVHHESRENVRSKQYEFIRWATIRVVQAQQQKKNFAPSSQINDTIYTAPSEGNCDVATTSLNLTLESTQHSMLNLDSCNDYYYESTAVKQEQLFSKELFLEEV